MATRTSDDLLVFGKALRTRRKAVGLTLGDVAQQVGVTAGQLSRIETGKSRPSYDTLIRLRDAVGQSASDGNLPLPRAAPDDTLPARLGALLSVRHSLALGEASRLLETSVLQ